MIYSKAKKYIKENYTTLTTAELAVHCGIRQNVIVLICLELGVVPVKRNLRKSYGPYKPKAQVPTVTAADFIVRKSKMERPPAVYNNSPSPYGFAD